MKVTEETWTFTSDADGKILHTNGYRGSQELRELSSAQCALVSAAPELFRALERMLNVPPSADDYAAAHLALAKARGEA